MASTALRAHTLPRHRGPSRVGRSSGRSPLPGPGVWRGTAGLQAYAPLGCRAVGVTLRRRPRPCTSARTTRCARTGTSRLGQVRKGSAGFATLPRKDRPNGRSYSRRKQNSRCANGPAALRRVAESDGSAPHPRTRLPETVHGCLSHVERMAYFPRCAHLAAAQGNSYLKGDTLLRGAVLSTCAFPEPCC